jgi:hypothetical protein
LKIEVVVRSLYNQHYSVKTSKVKKIKMASKERAIDRILAESAGLQEELDGRMRKIARTVRDIKKLKASILAVPKEFRGPLIAGEEQVIAEMTKSVDEETASCSAIEGLLDSNMSAVSTLEKAIDDEKCTSRHIILYLRTSANAMEGHCLMGDHVIFDGVAVKLGHDLTDEEQNEYNKQVAILSKELLDTSAIWDKREFETMRSGRPIKEKEFDESEFIRRVTQFLFCKVRDATRVRRF